MSPECGSISLLSDGSEIECGHLGSWGSGILCFLSLFGPSHLLVTLLLVFLGPHEKLMLESHLSVLVVCSVPSFVFLRVHEKVLYSNVYRIR